MEKSSNYEAVPEAKTARPQLNCEIADEIEGKITQNEYFGTRTSKKYSSVGGSIVQRLIKITEEQLVGRR